VTTFRYDGRYTDGRHPEQVEFTSDLEADLAGAILPLMLWLGIRWLTPWWIPGEAAEI